MTSTGFFGSATVVWPPGPPGTFIGGGGGGGGGGSLTGSASGNVVFFAGAAVCRNGALPATSVEKKRVLSRAGDGFSVAGAAAGTAGDAVTFFCAVPTGSGPAAAREVVAL
jgi:hypothetical protein